MIRSMIRSMSALAALGALAAFVCLPVGAGAADPALDAPVADAAKAFEEKTGLTDFGLLMMRDEEILYRRFFGGYTETTAVPIASATKWITGATVMTLVDAGRIDLDSPVKTWLPELPSPHGDLTLRQLLSYTAGFPSLAERIDLKQDRTISLLEAAIALKDVALVDEPGTAYAYGGPNFQIAGAVVERVSGQRWADYFDEVLGDP
ncbi:MAG: beta-lactamase family protein, partial [Alphaproteobacteria bacterium]|nr:beta-lactamase family protein [Alphaproteobacteria bacterium]